MISKNSDLKYSTAPTKIIISVTECKINNHSYRIFIGNYSTDKTTPYINNLIIDSFSFYYPFEQ